MDYLHPVEALIPGARGRVLAALAANTSPQTIRQVALRAKVSPSRAGQLLEDLAELGVVERRELGGSHVLVRLTPGNVAAGLIVEAVSLWTAALEAMRQAATSIEPVPLTLTVFGSFARGQAQRGSDVDVFAVHGHEDDSSEAGSWLETTGQWIDRAGRITGNRVNFIDLGLEEVQALGGATELPPGWLRSADREGVVLAGVPVRKLVRMPVGRYVR